MTDQALCDGSAQAECGVVPFMCCEAYFGWAEKLEMLGGRSWDLPCGCGLQHCQVRKLQNSMQACCTPKAAGARKKYGENCGRNPPVKALPRLVPDDSDTYSSSILREFVKGHLQREDPKFCLTSMALHRGIVGDEARRYCQDLIGRFLVAHQTAALHRIAKASDHHEVKGDERLGSLASKATDELVKWDKLKKPQTMSKIVWAMAKLEVKLQKLVSKVSEEALEKLPEFEPQQLVNMMWAYATMRSEEPTLRQLDALHGRLHSLAPLGQANLAWAVAKLMVRDWNTEELVTECRMAVKEMNGQNLANTSWAFATLRIADEDFFDAVVTQVVKNQCHDFGQQNLSNTAWAFAKVQIKRPEMMSSISRSVQRMSDKMPAQGVANTVWAFATLHIRDDPLMLGPPMTERSLFP
eukprot:symbB.v1.2.020769.t1/scaffold1749.1/size103200/9